MGFQSTASPACTMGLRSLLISEKRDPDPASCFPLLFSPSFHFEFLSVCTRYYRHSFFCSSRPRFTRGWCALCSLGSLLIPTLDCVTPSLLYHRSLFIDVPFDSVLLVRGISVSPQKAAFKRPACMRIRLANACSVNLGTDLPRLCLSILFNQSTRGPSRTTNRNRFRSYQPRIRAQTPDFGVDDTPYFEPFSIREIERGALSSLRLPRQTNCSISRGEQKAGKQIRAGRKRNQLVHARD